MAKSTLKNTRQNDFAAWYQEVVVAADLAEESGVRGCMVIQPWGYGIWERIQRLLDDQIKAEGHENCYFPLFIPLSYLEKEAEHVSGFAKEMAVVTHHRLIEKNGHLVPDPEAKLEEPLVVRPTSETLIGAAFSRWVKSWRDLPVLINQWANVVRWEMRTRMFLRTTEFLWQEGHTVHASTEQAMSETLKILELYRNFAEECLAMPVVAGEKPEHERFPGAVATYSIEAMMQDGKALQAGTSHYLGTNFAQAQNIRFQNRKGSLTLAQTTSWGVSTRLIGGVIMTHGDDDGLRVPPRIAPWQVVIIPMLRDNEGDDIILDYCQTLAKQLLRETAWSGEPIRAKLDKRAGKAAHKRWKWIKRGAPVIVEIGARDATGNTVGWLRRDALYGGGGGSKINSKTSERGDFVAGIAAVLESIQHSLFVAARDLRDSRIRRDVVDMEHIRAIFAEDTRDTGDAKNTKNAGDKTSPGWVEVNWSKPTGEVLEKIANDLKELKLTIRNAPQDAQPAAGLCAFTGGPATERILIGRAY